MTKTRERIENSLKTLRLLLVGGFLPANDVSAEVYSEVSVSIPGVSRQDRNAAF